MMSGYGRSPENPSAWEWHEVECPDEILELQRAYSLSDRAAVLLASLEIWCLAQEVRERLIQSGTDPSTILEWPDYRRALAIYLSELESAVADSRGQRP